MTPKKPLLEKDDIPVGPKGGDLQLVLDRLSTLDESQVRSIMNRIERAQSLPTPRERIEALAILVIRELPKILVLL